MSLRAEAAMRFNDSSGSCRSHDIIALEIISKHLIRQGFLASDEERELGAKMYYFVEFLPVYVHFLGGP